MPEAEKTPASFEAGLDQLEIVVKELERGDLPLERALELFERGMQLTESCRRQLEQAETRVEMLVKKNEKIKAVPLGIAGDEDIPF